jgi:hypothetical protein
MGSKGPGWGDDQDPVVALQDSSLTATPAARPFAAQLGSSQRFRPEQVDQLCGCLLIEPQLDHRCGVAAVEIGGEASIHRPQKSLSVRLAGRVHVDPIHLFPLSVDTGQAVPRQWKRATETRGSRRYVDAAT